jgi:hypothetical protein
METNETLKTTCCICGGGIETEPYFHGSNPWPVKDADEWCCATCDTFVVLPARMRLFAEQQ